MIKRLAILMATYNGEKYIKEQIESILNQDTDFDFTLIIRDDGSTDNT
ncbi:glycosyltransferase, partial [Streptococcus pneumoniae]